MRIPRMSDCLIACSCFGLWGIRKMAARKRFAVAQRFRRPCLVSDIVTGNVDPLQASWCKVQVASGKWCKKNASASIRFVAAADVWDTAPGDPPGANLILQTSAGRSFEYVGPLGTRQPKILTKLRPGRPWRIAGAARLHLEGRDPGQRRPRQRHA